MYIIIIDDYQNEVSFMLKTISNLNWNFLQQIKGYIIIIIIIKQQMVKILLTPSLKILSFMLLCFSLITTARFFALYLHYSQIPMFDLQSLVGKPNAEKSNYILNIFLYSLFFIQHIVMSRTGFKKKMSQIYSLYPVYQRYMFNTVASLIYAFIINHSQYDNKVLFEIPAALSIFLSTMGYIFFGWSMYKFAMILWLPYGFINIFKLKQIEVDYEFKQKKKQLVQVGLYKVCRNPMQLGLMLLAIGAPVFTWDRIIFITITYIGIIIGVLQQEQKLQKEYEGYLNYKKRVSNRFIPNFLNLL